MNEMKIRILEFRNFVYLRARRHTDTLFSFLNASSVERLSDDAPELNRQKVGAVGCTPNVWLAADDFERNLASSKLTKTLEVRELTRATSHYLACF